VVDKESLLWDDWTDHLNFLSNIDDSDLRMHVGYLYLIGTPIEKDYWRAQNFRLGNTRTYFEMIEEYKKLISGLDSNFWFSEMDPNAAKFSVPYQPTPKKGGGQEYFLNSDVLRTQVDVSNLVNFGILPQVTNIIEIGAGYGQLAAAVTSMFPSIKYTIIDIPQQLEVQKRWLKHIGVNTGEEVTNQVRLCSALELNSLKQETDLIINVNSFCEMQESDIRKYIDGSILSFNWLYSNNREMQFMNKKMQKPLSDIYQEYFELTPKVSDYTEASDSYIKYVFVGGANSKINQIPLVEVHGIGKWKNSFEVN